MRRTLIAIALLALAGGAVYAALALRGEKPVSVNVAPVGRGEVARTVVNSRAGSVRACRRARLAPAQGGVVSEVRVEEGDRVAAGDLILSLWNEDLAARLALAREQVRAARANADRACALADSAEREWQRIRRLHRQGLASDEQRDQARSQARSQAAQCRAQKAQVAVAERQVAVAEANLERTRLRAPFAGEVGELNVAVGEYLGPAPAPGAPPAVDLIDRGCLYVEAPIDEVDADEVAVGLPVRVTLDAFGERVFPGEVRRIAPYVREVEKQARTVDVRVEFTPEVDTRPLLPGYSADVEIVIATHADVLRVPTEAVVEGGWVWVLGPDGRLAKRRIRTGLSNWRWTEVVSGLSEGERVVVSVDREGLAEGRPAVPEEEEENE